MEIGRICQPEPGRCPWPLLPQSPQSRDWPWFPADSKPSLRREAWWTANSLFDTLIQGLENPSGSCLEGFTWFLLHAPWSEQNTRDVHLCNNHHFLENSVTISQGFPTMWILRPTWIKLFAYLFGPVTYDGGTVFGHVGFQRGSTF